MITLLRFRDTKTKETWEATKLDRSTHGMISNKTPKSKIWSLHRPTTSKNQGFSMISTIWRRWRPSKTQGWIAPKKWTTIQCTEQLRLKRTFTRTTTASAKNSRDQAAPPSTTNHTASNHVTTASSSSNHNRISFWSGRPSWVKTATIRARVACWTLQGKTTKNSVLQSWQKTRRLKTSYDYLLWNLIQ